MLDHFNSDLVWLEVAITPSGVFALAAAVGFVACWFVLRGQGGGRNGR